MTKDEFITKFRNQFDETEPDKIDFETMFKELEEWSSMTALIIIAMADEEYNFKLSGDDIRNSNTVQDLYDLIKIKSLT
jgi:acyl carrier protein